MTTYVLRHHGECDPECNGNPVLVDESFLPFLQEKFDDWNVDEHGVITSKGDWKWQADGKYARLTPVLESDLALPREVREGYLTQNAHKVFPLDVKFKVKSVPVVEGIPEMIAEHRRPILESMEKRGVDWDGVISFIMATGKVSNVCITGDTPETISVSGFDHDLMTQFTFTLK